MKRFSSLMILTCLVVLFAHGQDNEIKVLLDELKSYEWNKVLQAKEKLENLEAEAIPYIIPMLQDKSVRKLTNTGDLIYPGAEKFFGHGQIIDYDIDKTDVRAGWLLEELAFQNFGFTGVHIQADDLSDYIRFNFPKYYTNSKNRKLVDTSSETEKREMIRNLSTKEAEKWWADQADTWNRFDALVEALGSDDEKRQAKALFYIRNGKTSCTGLNRESYKSDIKNIVLELSKSPLKRISEQSKLILLDTDFDWLSLKPSAN
jgi:hypothetical protein